MSRKRCIRKVWAKVNPIEHAMQGAAITSRQDMDKLLLRETAALDAIVKGQGGLKEWHDLCAVNNLAQTLAQKGVGHEVLEPARKAETALIDAATRFQRTGRMGFTGEGIQAMREIIEWHDLQRASIPRSQYEEAIRLTVARVKSGYATIDLDATIGKPVTA